MGSGRTQCRTTRLEQSCYASEVGWTRLPRRDADAMRGGQDSTLLPQVLTEQLQRLNPGVVDRGRAEQLLHRIGRVPPSLAGNLEVWEHRSV